MAAAIVVLPAMAEPFDLRVMTFNLKYASERGENKWSERRPVLKNTILSEDPDLIGTQEGVYHQIRDIETDLPGYRWIGLGRAGGSKEEFMAIFYKTSRFDPVAFDHFWLSDTPDVIGSRTWGHDNRRMVTWVRFRDKAADREFYHWNTHFDHRVQAAREKSADLVIGRLRRMNPLLPVVVTGDFNAHQNNIVHEKLLGRSGRTFYLRDAWDVTNTHGGRQISTIHGWRGPSGGDRRIDWILISPSFVCSGAKVVTYSENGQFPSDHFPVVCDLTLP